MSTTTTSGISPREFNDYEKYRELSSVAVVSLLAGALSLLLLAFIQVFNNPVVFGLLPALGIMLGLRAVWKIRGCDGMTGAGFAWSGTALSSLALAAGWGWMGYVYATEVPEGYQRAFYSQLQPQGQQVIPPSARELDGKKVFIKGYVYPAINSTTGTRRFILCRDNGACCFGGVPKLNDMIQVTLRESQTLDYNSVGLSLVKVAGTFRVEDDVALHDLGTVVYHLDEAEYSQ